MGRFFMILFFIFSLSFITLLLRIKLIKYCSQLLKNKKSSFWLFHMPSIILFKESTRLAFVNTIDAIKIVTGFLHIENKLESLQYAIFGLEEAKPSSFNNNTTFLVLPLLIENKITTKDAFEKSKELLEKNLGTNLSFNYSFKGFMTRVSLLIFIFLGGFSHFLLNLNIFPTLIICIIAIISIASFIENVTLILKVALYHLFINDNITPFTEKELFKVFKNKVN
jgi:hypothetical protein